MLEEDCAMFDADRETGKTGGSQTMEVQQTQMAKQGRFRLADDFSRHRPERHPAEKSQYDIYLDFALMTGTAIGAIFGSVFSKCFVGSEFGLGFGMLGLIIGGFLFTTIFVIFSSLFHFSTPSNASGFNATDFSSHLRDSDSH